MHFTDAPPPPGGHRFDGEFCTMMVHPMPFALPVEPRGDLTPEKVDAALAEARAHARAEGKDHGLAWLTGPDLPWLGAELAARGLANEDVAGFESVENAMALVEPPSGSAASEAEVTLVSTQEQFRAHQRVQMGGFGVDVEDQAAFEARLDARWQEASDPASHVLNWIASLDGEVIAAASAFVLPGGLNLAGGAVASAARGRGAYRALVQARWEEAVRRGTPALTVQAGRMSAPILAKLGFVHLAEMPVYVDRR